MKVKDPVCGMVIDDKDASKSTYQGTTYYFCATECKEQFDRNPAEYVSAGAPATPR